jgi:hypothetical protein
MTSKHSTLNLYDDLNVESAKKHYQTKVHTDRVDLVAKDNPIIIRSQRVGVCNVTNGKTTVVIDDIGQKFVTIEDGLHHEITQRQTAITTEQNARASNIQEVKQDYIQLFAGERSARSTEKIEILAAINEEKNQRQAADFQEQKTRANEDAAINTSIDNLRAETEAADVQIRADHYDKEVTNGLLALKADQSNMENLLATKAPQNNTYTKTESQALVNEKVGHETTARTDAINLLNNNITARLDTNAGNIADNKNRLDLIMDGINEPALDQLKEIIADYQAMDTSAAIQHQELKNNVITLTGNFNALKDIVDRLLETTDESERPIFNVAVIYEDFQNPGAGNFNGSSVAVSADGSRYVVGAPQTGSGKGFIRVVEKNVVTGAYERIGGELYGISSFDEFGSAVDMSRDGTVVAAVARNVDGKGYTRVYEYKDNAWAQRGDDLMSDQEQDHPMSVMLSADGTCVAVGAYKHDNNSNIDAGHVRVFEFVTGQWQQKGNDIVGLAAQDGTGISIDISGDGSAIAVGAWRHNELDGVVGSRGHVRVFKYADSVSDWQQMGDHIEGTVGQVPFTSFRLSMSDTGEKLAVVSPLSDTTTAVSVYAWHESLNWERIGTPLHAPVGTQNFGIAVSMSPDGDMLAVGTSSSKVYVYAYDTLVLAWRVRGEVSDPTGEASKFGEALAISNNKHVVIGASSTPYVATGTTLSNSGAVRLYELTEPQ